MRFQEAHHFVSCGEYIHFIPVDDLDVELDIPLLAVIIENLQVAGQTVHILVPVAACGHIALDPAHDNAFSANLLRHVDVLLHAVNGRLGDIRNIAHQVALALGVQAAGDDHSNLAAALGDRFGNAFIIQLRIFAGVYLNGLKAQGARFLDIACNIADHQDGCGERRSVRRRNRQFPLFHMYPPTWKSGKEGKPAASPPS